MYSFLDFAKKYQIGFQDPATPIMEGIINLHHTIMFFLILLITFITWILFRIIYNFWYSNFLYNLNSNIKDNLSLRFYRNDKFIHGTLIEVIWTIIPSIFLIFIAIPSFTLLYTMDEIIDPFLTIKVIGHQWYWSYEAYLPFIKY
jgi:cytochrome c oxidase subunit 2